MTKPVTSADISRLKQSVPKALREMELATQIYVDVGPNQNDWQDHKTFVAFIAYLTRMDYEIKVVLSQFLSDPDNRTVWEGQLFLLLHGAMDHVPKALGLVIRELRQQPDTTSHLDLEKLQRASKRFNREVKEIKSDSNFTDGLVLVRNGVVAHHGFDQGKAGEEAIGWVYSRMLSRLKGYRPKDSQTAEYGVQLGRALQELGTDLLSVPGAMH